MSGERFIRSVTEASHHRLGCEDGVHCDWLVVELSDGDAHRDLLSRRVYTDSPPRRTGRRSATPPCRECGIVSTAA